MHLTKRLVIPASEISERFLLKERIEFALARISSSKARKEFAYELPDYLLALAISLKSGLAVLPALEWIAGNATGRLAAQFKECVENVSLGADLQLELAEVAKRFPDSILEDLVQKLSAALTLGIPIANELLQLSEVASGQVNQKVAKQVGSNETKMLVPTIFLILPITVLFAVFPSLSMLGIS